MPEQDMNNEKSNPMSIGEQLVNMAQASEEPSKDAVDEVVSYKEEYYDVSKYKDEIGSFIKEKRVELDLLSNMQANYEALKKSIFAGSTDSDEERYPHAAEMFKVYKSAIIESSLSGYSALLEISGRDAYSTLKVPELKEYFKVQNQIRI